MARTPITPQRVTSAGLAPAAEPANVDGNSMPLSPGHVLLVDNGSAAAVTVTIPTPAKFDGLDVAERTINVPAGEAWHINLGGQPVYRQPGGVAHIDYSPAPDATVTVAVLQV
ncbi:hypothetical protein CLV30_12824 [Haloactinopolyspora alba]|uniref:Uncharacterized protein n=1 Tax=Haloactinopolyspora alba TaxID=648780 RepID=A0A2P8DEY9_9ACTN|nr:hypothetical protein [Haloactinopolyspora alba]PSK95772.1 hypothetical protein CLV30_12824 [Haloactinopolyspora alba]